MPDIEVEIRWASDAEKNRALNHILKAKGKVVRETSGRIVAAIPEGSISVLRSSHLSCHYPTAYTSANVEIPRDLVELFDATKLLLSAQPDRLRNLYQNSLQVKGKLWDSIATRLNALESKSVAMGAVDTVVPDSGSALEADFYLVRFNRPEWRDELAKKSLEWLPYRDPKSAVMYLKPTELQNVRTLAIVAEIQRYAMITPFHSMGCHLDRAERTSTE